MTPQTKDTIDEIVDNIDELLTGRNEVGGVYFAEYADLQDYVRSKVTTLVEQVEREAREEQTKRWLATKEDYIPIENVDPVLTAFIKQNFDMGNHRTMLHSIRSYIRNLLNK